jgi:hypothetical protein
MPNIHGHHKLVVTTIRYGVTEPQIADFIDSYLKDERGKKRIDEISFWANGKSRTIIEELGMQIETIIRLEPMTDSDVAGVR